jgi:DNA polymerase III sliding clamp (beta) subunit (PCNA family)
MNHITIIPKFQRKKSIPKQLKDLQLLPLNEQFSKLTMSIVGDDDLRPVMTGNFFDVESKKIVSTDAHKLTAINMPQETFSYLNEKYAEELKKEPRGLIFHTKSQLEKDYNKLAKLISEKKGDILTFDEFVKQREIEDGRYPNYNAVIPKQFIAEINVDYQKLYWYAKVLSDAKVIDDDNKINASNENEYQNKKIEYLKDSYVSFISPITHQIILTYTIDGQIQYIGFNANFICELLKFAMELNGKYFGKLGISSNSGAMVVELEDGLDSRKDSVGLIMPVILVNNPDYTIGQREFEKNVSLYYDLDTNSIVSDEQGYLIDESIGFVPVKGVLTAPRLQVEPQASEADNSSLILIINRLKGLRIALKVAKSENKPSIEKRIKGLEIAIKMQKDDLPFKNGGSVKKRILVVLDEGNGKVINDLFNQWYSIKNDKEYNVWAEKIKNTNFGTYGTTNINDVLEKFEFDKSKVNEVTKKDFKKEINNVRNK